MPKNVNPWWFAAVSFAFASVICGFQVNSYFADQYKLNNLAIGLSAFFAIVTIVCIVKAASTFTGKGG